MTPRDGRVVSPKPAYRRKGQYDYRRGVSYAITPARGYQPRKDGPPLLFATDIRMTLLVNLALASSAVRPCWLWSHIGRKCHTALCDLIARGLVFKWGSRKRTVVALDPCHPAARELRELLVAVGNEYGFRPIPEDVEARIAGEAPTRPSRRRDVRDTFGDKHRTMILLLVHVLGETIATDIERCLGYVHGKTVYGILYMYRAFGLLKSRYAVVRKKRVIAFSFNDDHPLSAHVRAVLGALDGLMPQWRRAAERQRVSPIPRQWDRRRRRRAGKWKPKSKIYDSAVNSIPAGAYEDESAEDF